MRRALLGLVLFGAVAAFAQDDGGAAMELEPFEPAGDAPLDAGPALESFETFESDAGTSALPVLEAFKPQPAGPTVRFFGFASAYTAVDTRFDSPRGAPMAENVWESRARAVIGADVKWNEHLRFVVEGRAQVRGTSQRDFDRAKAFFEPTLGEAFVDLYTPMVDLRVGNQRIPLGANAAMAPADSLNPRDLREAPGAGDVDMVQLPVFAVRAQGEVGKVSWLAAYVPFFQPNTYSVFGEDQAVLQPGLGPAFDDRRIDPSVEDHLQSRVLETQRPAPFVGDVALRLRTNTTVKVGASWVWMNEKMPRVTMDPELQAVLAAQAAGRQVDQATALSTLNRFQAGETLYRGFYGRQHLFSLEGSALLGPGQLDVDVTYSPRQTLYLQNFAPTDKQTLTWVASYAQAEDSIVSWGVSYFGMAIPGVAANEQLVVLEPATVLGGAHTSFLHLLLGTVGVQLLDKKLELAVRGAFEVVQRSWALMPRVTWQALDALQVYLSAEIYQGNPWSPFGYFDRNDRVFVGARYEL